MKVSKKFLNDYVDIKNIKAKDLADKLVEVGNEYDSTSRLVNVTGLTIGKILSCEKHPDSNKLHICMVDLGNEIVQIICGAPNVKKDQKVIVAKVGAKLPGGEIKKAKLAGLESNGMICSIAELGLEHKYLKPEDINGICELGEDAKVGEDPLEYLELNDDVIDFDFTTNRADMLSYRGIAYEVGAAYNLDIKKPINEVEEVKDKIDVKLDIQTDKCTIYLGKLVKDVKIKESPKFIQNRLIASGIRPINNVVDISNYVMLELGTPLHFFDADKLGKNVIVREAKKDEKLTTLDGKHRTLDTTDIVIANTNKAVALAGVMGGLDTEVDENTKNIFIECAIFNPTSIRLTSKKIVRSEASNRYEKGIDPSIIEFAIKRAAYLLNKYAEGKVCTGIAKYDKTDKTDKIIKVTLDKINLVLGMNLTKEDVIDCLTRLKFKVEEKNNEFTVYVPTRRLDVNIKEDIIEEVGRIYGYDKIEGILPTLKTKIGGRSKKKEMIRTVRKQLEALGLNEVITYSLLSDSKSELFENKLEKVKILNPMSEDRKVLRTTLITSLLEVYEYNLTHNVKNINIFETGSIYFKEDNYTEQTRVAGLMYGEYLINNWQGIKVNIDFYTIKGVVENLLNYLGFKNRISYKKADLKDMHPNRSAQILLDKQVIGEIGEVHPNLSKKPVYVFELNITKLLDIKVKPLKYKEISKYPSVIKDVAFALDKNISSDEVLNVIKKAGGHILSDVKLFDVYVGENISNDKKSLAYSLTFASDKKTLEETEVMEQFNKIIKEVEDKLGAQLRDK